MTCAATFRFMNLGVSPGASSRRSRRGRSLLFLLLALAVFPAGLRAGPTNLVFIHATVIDATGAAPQPDSTVVITGGRIAEVGKSADVLPPTNAQIINAAGKFLIPGLWDMHAHWSDKEYLPLFIANGVTGTRIMWGFPDHHKWRTQIEQGSLVGPRMFIASALVDGPKPLWPDAMVAGTAEEGRQAVIKARQDGADFVKVYSMLPRDAYFAIADEAKKQGIPFEGHTPIAVSAGEASDAGQKSIEHLTEILAACSSRQAELLKQAQDTLVERLATNNPPSATKHLLDSKTVELETYDAAKAEALFAQFKKNQTWQCPTLTVLRNITHLDDPSIREDPRSKYMPSYLRQFWNPTNDFRFKGRTAESVALGKKTFQKEVELVGAMNRAGVGILAGTDVSNPFCFPGFSLHDELGLLVQAGLTPMQALQAATLNPARFMWPRSESGAPSRKAGSQTSCCWTPILWTTSATPGKSTRLFTAADCFHANHSRACCRPPKRTPQKANFQSPKLLI